MPRKESMCSCVIDAISNMGEIDLRCIYMGSISPIYMYFLCDISSSPNFLKFEVKTVIPIQTTRS